MCDVIDAKLWSARKLANDIKSGAIDPKDIELKKISSAKKVLKDAGYAHLSEMLMGAYAKSFSHKMTKNASECRIEEEKLLKIFSNMMKSWVKNSSYIDLPFLLRRYYKSSDRVDSVIHAINDVIFSAGFVPRHLFCELEKSIDSVLAVVKDELAVRRVEAINITLADVKNKSMNSAIGMAERVIEKIDHAIALIREYEQQKKL